MDNNSLKAKVLVIGPKKAGKTRIANYLGEFEESPNFEQYNPTAGVRILEFEREIPRVTKKGGPQRTVKLQVELWDCSGDKKYEHCWPAILKDAHGVVMAYNPEVKTQEKDIELWHKAFVSPLNLADSCILTFAHHSEGGGQAPRAKAPKALIKFQHCNTSLDSDKDSGAMRQEFDTLLSNVASVLMDKRESEMESAIRSLNN